MGENQEVVMKSDTPDCQQNVTDSDKSDTALVGHARIQAYLKTLDGSPGVYRMLDAESRVLYVGKARNLRARVSNYARPSGHSARIETSTSRDDYSYSTKARGY